MSQRLRLRVFARASAPVRLLMLPVRVLHRLAGLGVRIEIQIRRTRAGAPLAPRYKLTTAEGGPVS